MSLKLCYCFIVTACWFTFLTKRKWYNYSISWNYLIVQTIYPELLGLWTSWSKAAFKRNLFFFPLKKKNLNLLHSKSSIPSKPRNQNWNWRLQISKYLNSHVFYVFFSIGALPISTFFFLRDSFSLWYLLLIITLCHHIKTSILTFYQ